MIRVNLNHTHKLLLAYGKEFETSLKRLLETKHLYQTEKIDLAPCQALIATAASPDGQSYDNAYRQNLQRALGNAESIMRIVWDSNTSRAYEANLQLIAGNKMRTDGHIYCSLPTVCRACHECSAQDPPHNPGFVGGTVSEPLLTQEFISDQGKVIQLWVMSFQCQACKKEPVLYQVRRMGNKLQIVGRSIFDRVSPPSFIPKHLHDYYSESLVASRAGKFLPACLYLRILIEKHIQEVSDVTQSRPSGDELGAAYSLVLSDEFPRSEASLKDIYGRLSEVIHSGKENDEVFVESLRIINRHFELLRLIPLKIRTSEQQEHQDVLN